MSYQTIPLGNATTLAPGDGFNAFWSVNPGNPGGAYDTFLESNYEIAEAGTIEAVSFAIKVGATLALTPSGDVTFSINLNDTTNIATVAGTYYDAAFETFTVTGLSQAVVAGDKIAFEVQCPSWGTNPTLTTSWALVFIASSGGAAPVADFTGTPTSGAPSLSVAFADNSTNTPTSWLWDFGDGSTSTDQNPTHTYSADGLYTVTLTATNATGSDGETKTDYISVVTRPGGGRGDLKPRKKKKGLVIRRSDFESLEAYKAAVASIPIVHVPHDVPAPQEIVDEDDEDDELILKTISVLLH